MWGDLEIRAVVDTRAGGLCERCGARLGWNFSRHHRRPRGMGGTSVEVTPAGLLVLCGSGTTGCHGWIESHRAEARVHGWLLGPIDDPEEVPVDYRGRWVQLADSSIVTFIGFTEELRRGLPRPTAWR